MEAKVDVRKLQILNDRINQTIDALNQVRLSVHGLGHSGGLQPLNPYAFMTHQGYGMGQPFGMGQPYGVGQPYGMGAPGLFSGLQHSPYQSFANPFISPLTTPFGSPFGSPFGQTGAPWSLFGQTGGFGGGLFHSGTDVIERQLIEARANDPFRITQTFPFVVS